MSQTTTATPLVAQAVQAVLEEPLPFRITAYDGTDIGPRDSDIAVRVESEEGLRYLLSAPGDLGLARAYLTGTLTGTGFHPGDPYEVFSRIKRDVRTKQLTPKGVASALAPVVKQLGPKAFVHPPLPEVENEPRWKRHLAKVNPVRRAADSIKHHYDVSNAFYEKVLGDSMAYTCAVFDTPDDTLEEAQERKFALVADKLDLQPGQRLLDVGCGWGGMTMHAARERGVHVIGVTLSKEQAEWGQRAVREAGLESLVEIRHGDYREVTETGFDAVSSIGLTEHIGVKNYANYFSFLHSKLRDGGRLLNHCITRRDDTASAKPEPFTDRYVFPDGELASPGRLISECHDAGFEVQHDENLRLSYALTLRDWCRNLEANWDFCVAEAGLPTAKVWGIYMAGSRLGFEEGWLHLHQVLATKTTDNGDNGGYPLGSHWAP
ncbi:cyclopropane-fatty-acyl-phospholipid synthase [Dermacoccus nishinomiyaensis]|uniref:Cyclopropane-fatty-acyl-phospholipid synthase n=1 Tax=Dermacoccus nishinomiyaensis TaxID=1274 RepID=A0A075JCB6_9MICO|nr:cyclopropane-fatty-acyl-phospholipid synthase family protein [Dermacoccus nishinomiyaensis]AIF39921.1 cyclopropane-fatty-acyl-phospholipid synthase [Dermacoccus nishinomiyaensis]